MRTLNVIDRAILKLCKERGYPPEWYKENIWDIELIYRKIKEIDPAMDIGTLMFMLRTLPNVKLYNIKGRIYVYYRLNV